MRTLLLELRPATLVEADFGDLLHQLAEAATGREGIPVRVESQEMVKLPSDVHIALYRITQEALNNVTRHANATHMEVSLRRVSVENGAALELCVCDDGCGFDPTHVPAGRLGLCGMRERAQAIGATLAVESAAGCGTEVIVLWGGPASA